MALAILMAIWMQAAATQAAESPPAPIISGLVRKPSVNDMARNYPQGAQRRNVEGDTELTCKLAETGALVDCTVSAEDPPGFEFGAAALRLAPMYRAKPPKIGEAGALVRMPILFHLPYDPGNVRTKPITVRTGSPFGHAEVSCQVFTGRLGNCFVLKADTTPLGVAALNTAIKLPPGDLPLGLRFILPMEFAPDAVAKP